MTAIPDINCEVKPNWWDVIIYDQPTESGNLDYDDDFGAWKNALEFELHLMMNQPRTEENIAEIAAMVDWYFSDLVLFQHSDHEVLVERDGIDGITISVLMDYENPELFHEDFNICEDEIIMMDLHEIAELAALDGATMEQVFNGGTSVEDNLIDEAHWAIARQIAAKMNADLLRHVDDTRAEMLIQKAAMGEETEAKSQPQSVEDMLFEPIAVTKVEEKKPEPPYDAGCYC